MKKLFTLAIIGFLTMQLAIGQNPIPNPGFESWSGNTPSGWSTLSMIIPLSKIEKTTDKHSGEYAVKLITEKKKILENEIPMPGFLFSGNIDAMKLLELFGSIDPENPNGIDLDITMLSQIIKGGIPIDGMVTSIKGHYKYSPVASDSMAAIVYLSKYDPELKVSVPVAVGYFSSGATVNSYTEFTIDIESIMETETDLVPDTMNIAFISSTGLGGETIGSALYIDNLSVVYDPKVTSCDNQLESTKFSTYPNPTKGIFTLTHKENTKTNVEIYNLNGVKIYQKTSIENNTSIDLSKQPEGIYVIKVGTEGKRDAIQNIILAK